MLWMDREMSASSYVVPYAVSPKQIDVRNHVGGAERIELTRDQLSLLI
jgi:hypothetical protein